MADSWYVDGVNLSTYAFNIENRSAGWSMPSPVGENLKVPGRSGAFWVPNKAFDETELNLNMWALGATSTGLLPTDSTSRQQCLRNLDGLSSLFGQHSRLLEVSRVSSTPNQGLTNMVLNPTLQNSTTNSDWTDLVPGWNSKVNTSTIQNYFQNPNLSTLNTTLAKNTTGTRVLITTGPYTGQYAIQTVASTTGPAYLTLTGTISSALSTSFVAGGTIWTDTTDGMGIGSLVTITIQLRSGSTVNYTNSVSLTYVNGRTLYVLATPPTGTSFDNFVLTFSGTINAATSISLRQPFVNSSRAWTSCITGTTTNTSSQTYTWLGTANDSASQLVTTSKFSYQSDP